MRKRIAEIFGSALWGAILVLSIFASRLWGQGYASLTALCLLIALIVVAKFRIL